MSLEPRFFPARYWPFEGPHSGIGVILQATVAFQPIASFEDEYSIGLLRAAFAEVWEAELKSTVPVTHLRRLLKPPVPVAIALQFARLNVASEPQLEEGLIHLVSFLNSKLGEGLP